ncbi:MAG: outer membrane beta-barrel protein [Gemmatimonadota bacterium]|jgi:hypothetical protein
MQTRSLAVALAAGALMHLPAAGLLAQVSTTRGWNLGFHLLGSSLTVEDEELDTGGGAGIQVALGLNRRFSLFLNLDGAVVNEVEVEGQPDASGEWAIGHADLGVRFYFANSLRRWIPYLEAAFGWRAVGVDGVEVAGEPVDVSLGGGTFTLGGGVAYYFRENLAVDLTGKLSSGEFTDLKVGAVTVGGFEIDAQSGRIALGLSWWP